MDQHGTAASIVRPFVTIDGLLNALATAINFARHASLAGNDTREPDLTSPQTQFWKRSSPIGGKRAIEHPKTGGPIGPGVSHRGRKKTLGPIGPEVSHRRVIARAMLHLTLRANWPRAFAGCGLSVRLPLPCFDFKEWQCRCSRMATLAFNTSPRITAPRPSGGGARRKNAQSLRFLSVVLARWCRNTPETREQR